MKKFNFTIAGNKYNVHIVDIENNTVALDVNGSKYKVEIEHEVKIGKTPTLVRERLPSPKKKDKNIQKKSSRDFEIQSPLPGSIFKMLVSVGDTVKSGDTLLIMEAMKMENNILSEQDGVIKKINVNVGDVVLQNDVLIVIE